MAIHQSSYSTLLAQQVFGVKILEKWHVNYSLSYLKFNVLETLSVVYWLPHYYLQTSKLVRELSNLILEVIALPSYSQMLNIVRPLQHHSSYRHVCGCGVSIEYVYSQKGEGEGGLFFLQIEPN